MEGRGKGYGKSREMKRERKFKKETTERKREIGRVERMGLRCSPEAKSLKEYSFGAKLIFFQRAPYLGKNEKTSPQLSLHG